MTRHKAAARHAAWLGFAASVAFHAVILAVRLPAPSVTDKRGGSDAESPRLAHHELRLIRLAPVEQRRPTVHSGGQDPCATRESPPAVRSPSTRGARRVAPPVVEASHARPPRPAWVFASNPRLWRSLPLAVGLEAIAHERLVLRARVAEVNHTQPLPRRPSWSACRIGRAFAPTARVGGSHLVACTSDRQRCRPVWEGASIQSTAVSGSYPIVASNTPPGSVPTARFGDRRRGWCSNVNGGSGHRPFANAETPRDATRSVGRATEAYRPTCGSR
jgi:hypothetical protein